MMILYFNLNPCCILEVSFGMRIGYSLKHSKVIEQPIKDSPLPIEGGYT